MNQLLKPESLTLVALLVLTIASFFLLDHWSGDTTIKTFALTAIACVKSLLVAYIFMEVSHAPGRAKALIGAWIILLSILIANMPTVIKLLDIVTKMIQP